MAKNADDQLNIENNEKTEPITAATFLNQSSVTEDSEVRAANSYLMEVALCPTLLQEKHMQTLYKLIDVLLYTNNQLTVAR